MGRIGVCGARVVACVRTAQRGVRRSKVCGAASEILAEFGRQPEGCLFFDRVVNTIWDS